MDCSTLRKNPLELAPILPLMLLRANANDKTANSVWLSLLSFVFSVLPISLTSHSRERERESKREEQERGQREKTNVFTFASQSLPTRHLHSPLSLSFFFNAHNTFGPRSFYLFFFSLSVSLLYRKISTASICPARGHLEIKNKLIFFSLYLFIMSSWAFATSIDAAGLRRENRNKSGHLPILQNIFISSFTPNRCNERGGGGGGGPKHEQTMSSLFFLSPLCMPAYRYFLFPLPISG